LQSRADSVRAPCRTDYMQKRPSSAHQPTLYFRRMIAETPKVTQALVERCFGDSESAGEIDRHPLEGRRKLVRTLCWLVALFASLFGGRPVGCNRAARAMNPQATTIEKRAGSDRHAHRNFVPEQASSPGLPRFLISPLGHDPTSPQPAGASSLANGTPRPTCRPLDKKSKLFEKAVSDTPATSYLVGDCSGRTDERPVKATRNFIAFAPGTRYAVFLG